MQSLIIQMKLQPPRRVIDMQPNVSTQPSLRRIDVDTIQRTLDEIYRTEARRVLATLIRLLQGNFDLAEEAMHDAFTAALTHWSHNGMPDNPRAWLIAAGRNKAIDRLRKNSRFDASLSELVLYLEEQKQAPEEKSDEEIEDDRLRLIFTCCHPSLSMEAQVVLTLREVCGLTTEEIAAAFLIPPPTLAQRIVRAKAKIRDARIPYEVPAPRDFPERLDSVLQVIYLVFNEGYSASVGDALIKVDLSSEAIRLGRLLLSLLPDSEVAGLVALMLLHDARRAARTSSQGDLVLLEDQDRGLWDRTRINEGCALVTRALESHRFGPYTLQAAIAAVHAETPSAEQTDWSEIAGLYDALLRVNPSPIIELNRAVAIAMRDGPIAGLELIDGIFARQELLEYHLAYAAQAELYRRLDRTAEARCAYQRALDLTQQEPERRFLRQRIAELCDEKKVE